MCQIIQGRSERSLQTDSKNWSQLLCLYKVYKCIGAYIKAISQLCQIMTALKFAMMQALYYKYI